MKKNLKCLAMVVAVSVVCASSVQAGTAGDAPQKRTWGQYMSQKAAANNVFASRDSRNLASAQLKLGTIEQKQIKVDAEANRQQARSDKQADQLKKTAEANAKYDAANQRVKEQSERAAKLKQDRILARRTAPNNPAS